jgi:hypothetical protein
MPRPYLSISIGFMLSRIPTGEFSMSRPNPAAKIKISPAGLPPFQSAFAPNGGISSGSNDPAAM